MAFRYSQRGDRGFRGSLLALFVLLACFPGKPLQATVEPTVIPVLLLSKTASVDTVQSGLMFSFTLSYSISSANQSAANVVITDTLPSALDYSSVQLIGNPQVASTSFNPISGVATFTMLTPLAAGSSGSVQINVRFPEGSTPNLTVACNRATLSTSNAGSVQSNQVCVVARAVHRFEFFKDVFAGNAINGSVIYRLRVLNPTGNNIGGLNLMNASIKDTLPAGSVFVSATGGGTLSSGIVTWNLGNLLVSPWYNPAYVDLYLTLQYPSPPFSANQTVCNIGNLHGTPVGSPALSKRDTACVTLVAGQPGAQFLKGPSWSPMQNRVPGCNGYYFLYPSNSGNVPLDSMKITDVLPTQIRVTSFTTGTYTNFPGGQVTLRYRTTANPSWTSAGTFGTSQTIGVYTAPLNLPTNVYITELQWDYGTVPVGFAVNYPPTINFTLLANDFLTNTPVTVGNVITNCATLTYRYNTVAGTPITHCKTFTVDAFGPALSASKGILSTGPYFPGDTVRFIMYIYNMGTAALNNPVITDNLPGGLQYAGNVTYGSLNGAPNPSTLGPTITSGPGTVGFSFSSPFPAAGCGQSPYIYTIAFDAVIPPGTLPVTYCNAFVVGGSNHSNVTSSSACYLVNSVPTMESSKRVKGALDSVFSASGATVAGGAMDYQLTLTNTGNVAIKDIVVVDILPFLGDVGVVNWNTSRGSQWTPNLIGPVIAPPGVSVYYSMETNPCRSDLTLSGPGGCTGPAWYTYAGLIGGGYNITQVRSLKFNFGTLQLAPLQSFVLTWPMTAPIGAPVGQVACNSFGYVAKRADNNLVIGPAEPVQVCVEIKPPNPAIYGDRVWLDSDQDGMQDASEVGINGVTVELWNVGPDTTPGTFDDYLAVNNANNTIPFVVTANNMSSQPGYFQFTNLKPGTYYAKFFPPSGHLISPLNQGGPTQDSDADPVPGPTYGWTVPVTLAANAIDTTWDMGVYPRTPPVTDCKEFQAQSFIHGGAKCCWYIRFTHPQNASSILFSTQTPNTITSAIAPAGWTAIPQGGLYPAPSLTLNPSAPSPGIDTLQLCFHTITLPPQFVTITWLDAQGNTICSDTVMVDCSPEQGGGGTGGVKFKDSNGNGVLDKGEVGLAGWTIHLVSASTGRDRTTVTNADGEYRFDNLEAGTYYISEEQQPGWVQTAPESGVHTILLPSVDTLPRHHFGNLEPPCKIPEDTITLTAGTPDQFQGPEPAVVGAALNAWNANNYQLSLAGFDEGGEAPKSWFFGHTFTGYAKPGCWVMGAKLTIRMKAYGQGASNDGIGIVAGPNLAWYHSIAGLSQNGFWNPNQTETFILDLGALPMGTNGATSVLAALASGTFNIFVQNNTAVDYITLEVYICCPDDVGRAKIFGFKFHDLDGDGVWDPSEPAIPNWTINLSNGNTVLTDASGQYVFTVPAPATYTVSEASVFPWMQTAPPSGTHTITVAPGNSYGPLNFGNRKEEQPGGGTACDSLIGVSLDTACCQYNFTIANASNTPITSVSWSLTGGTLNSMGTAPCMPVALPLSGATSGVLTFSPSCPGNLGFMISATPNTPSGLIMLTLVVHHGDKDSCLIRVRYVCDRDMLTRCDSVTVKPFVFAGLDLSGRTFTIHNVKIPASPIVSVTIIPTPPPAFLQGGGLVIDGIGTFWSVPYTRIPITGFISASTSVKFNLGIDYTLGWTGTISLVIHHADGDSCQYTYGPWSATRPTGGGVLVSTSIGRKIYANRFRLHNTGKTRPVRWVSVQVVDREDRLIAGSGATWDGANRDVDAAELAHFEQGQTEALFTFASPVPVGGTSGTFDVVVTRDSGRSAPPLLRWTSYDAEGNALASDTIRITTPVLSVRGEGPSVPSGFDLIASYPNPVRGSATIDFSLDIGRTMRLELYSGNGERVDIIDQGYRSAGMHSAPYDASRLPAGAYYLRLVADGWSVIRPMVVVR